MMSGIQKPLFRFANITLRGDETGQKVYENYVTESINWSTYYWAPLKRENNKMYATGNRKQTVKVKDKSTELKETKNVYGRLRIIGRSSRDVDIEQAVGDYEFTLPPRSLFTKWFTITIP